MKQLTITLSDRQMAAIEAECLPYGITPEELARSTLFTAIYQDDENLECIAEKVSVEREWNFHLDWLHYLATGNGTRRPLLAAAEVNAETKAIANELQRLHPPEIPPDLKRLQEQTADAQPSRQNPAKESTGTDGVRRTTPAAVPADPVEPLAITIPGRLAAIIRFQAALDETTPEAIALNALISDAEAFAEQPSLGYGDRHKLASWLQEEQRSDPPESSRNASVASLPIPRPATQGGPFTFEAGQSEAGADRSPPQSPATWSKHGRCTVLRPPCRLFHFSKCPDSQHFPKLSFIVRMVRMVKAGTYTLIRVIPTRFCPHTFRNRSDHADHASHTLNFLFPNCFQFFTVLPDHAITM